MRHVEVHVMAKLESQNSISLKGEIWAECIWGVRDWWEDKGEVQIYPNMSYQGFGLWGVTENFYGSE